MNGTWSEVKIVIPVEAIEPVSGILYGMDVKGISIEDPNDILTREKGPLTWDYADINLFSEGADKGVIKAYFPDTDNISDHKKYIEEKIEELKNYGIVVDPYQVHTTDVREEDWANSWKKYYKPLEIGEKVVVVPIWEEYDAKPEQVIVKMDPGMAFGTGTHETTKMCIETLQEIIQGGETVFDVGTGSGILAITAKKLGASSVLAIDLDPVAVDSAKINGQENDVTMDVRQGDLLKDIEGQADVIIANIIADVIIYLSDKISPFLKEGGYFLASGIIHLQEEEVKEALVKNGFEILKIRRENDWRAMLCKKTKA